MGLYQLAQTVKINNMHYIKRIETKKYQTGGLVGDIFVPNGGGNNQSQGMDLPKVDFSNYAIDIKTTGFLDRMQKIEDMEMKRKRLEFDYKDLEFKQGKEYMDFAAKMIANIRGDIKSTSEAGGLADLNPTYRNVLDTNKNNSNKAILGVANAFMTGNKTQGMQLMADIAKTPDQEFLAANVFGKTVNGLADSLMKTTAGVMTAKAYEKLMKITTTKFNTMAEGMAALAPVAAEINQLVALNMKAADVTKYTDELFKVADLGQRQIVTMGKSPDGKDVYNKETSTALMPYNEFKSLGVDRMANDFAGQVLLQSRGVNPSDRAMVEIEFDKIYRPLYDAEAKTKPVEIESGMTRDKWALDDKLNEPLQMRLKEIEAKGDALKNKITEKAGGGKKTDAQITTESIKKALDDEFGFDAFPLEIIKFLESTNEKANIPTAARAWAKANGVEPIGGAAIPEEDLYNSEALPINSLQDLTDKYGIPFNPKTAALINGFVVTNDKELVSSIKKKFSKVTKKSSKFDSTIEEITGGKWDSSVKDALPGGLDIETHVFPVKALQTPKSSNRTTIPSLDWKEPTTAVDSTKLNNFFKFDE